MRTPPSSDFNAERVAPTRRLCFRFMCEVNGVLTDMSSYVKSLRVIRTAGDAKAVASFSSALSSELEITLVPADVHLGDNPIRSVVTLEVGFNNEYVKFFSGMIQRTRRHANGEVVVVALDNALPLTRQYVKSPSYFNVNSGVYIRELLELVGVTARMFPPSQTIFALDFDCEENSATTSAVREVSDTDDNGVNRTLVQPHRWYDYDHKNFRYESTENTRSHRMVVEPFTITHYSDRETYNVYGLVDPTRILTADNAGSRQYVPSPSGYGGGSVINPTVLYFPSGFGGFNYWLCVQGYPKLTLSETEVNLWKSNGFTFLIPEVDVQSKKGDPIVLVSNDGVTWSSPVFNNPLSTRPTYSSTTHVRYYDEYNKKYRTDHDMEAGDPRLGTFLCEPTMVYHNSRIYVVWREVAGKTEYWYYMYTTNGTTWSAKTRWISSGYQTHCSPALAVRNDGSLHVWWVNRTQNPNRLYHSTCSSVGGSLTDANTCSLDGLAGTRDIWRLSVIKDATAATNGFNACMTTCARGRLGASTDLFEASSATGESWQLSKRSLVARNTTGWDNGGVHSGAFVADVNVDTGETFDMWYSAFNNNETFGLGRTIVYQSVLSWGGTVPSKLPIGPIYYGPFVANKCIDGVTSAARFTIFPDGTGDTAEHWISFGGWFSSYAAQQQLLGAANFLMMEVNFGNNMKIVLGRDSSGITARIYRYVSGSWTQQTGTAITLNGTEYLYSATETFAGVEVGFRYVGSVLQTKVTVKFGSSSTVGSWVATTFVAADLQPLSGVCIASTFSGTIHTARYSNSFPGLRYDNLFVGVGQIPTTIPSRQYRLEKGLNTITAAAFQGTNVWEELKTVAESELGCLAWDGNGELRFYNRHHFSLPSNSGIVRTVNSDDDISSAIIAEDVSDIRNVIRVQVKSQDLKIADDLWSLDTHWIIKANSTSTYDVAIPGVLESLDTVASGGLDAGATRYRAAFVTGYDHGIPVTELNGVDGSLGGAESSIIITLVPYGKSIHVSIRNISSRDIVLMDGNGNNHFCIWGRTYTAARFRSEESSVIEVTDAESVATYGANEVEINLDYLVDSTSAYDLGMYVLRRYNIGLKKLEDINIVGDPLLEVGDRILVDIPQMGLLNSFWIEKIEDTLSPDVGYTQKVDLAVADEGNWFILDSNQLDSDAVLTY